MRSRSKSLLAAIIAIWLGIVGVGIAAYAAPTAVSVSNGGTGTTTAPSYGKLLVGNGSGGYNLVATSSLGISASSIAWGSITGTLASQTDLQSALDAKLSLASWFATTTSALTEGSNLYYTPARVASVIAGTTTDALDEGAGNLYYTLARWASALAGTTTDALPEGSINQYFTNGRVQSFVDTVAKGFFFSTTSADFWKTQSSFFSTTSTDYWQTQRNFFSTTSADHWVSLYDKGFFFSTTSVAFWNSVTDFFSTTSVAYWESTQSRWATTSTDHWESTKWRWSTTSTDYWKSVTTFTGASTTLLSNNNTFSGNNTFSNTITGSISGNAGTVGSMTAAQLIAAGFSTTSVDYWKTQQTFTGASTTLLANNNTWTGLNVFGNASTSAFTNSGSTWLTSLATPAGTVLAVDPNGKIIATTTSAGGVTGVSATYPVQSTGGATPVISLAFGTTTANSWSALQSLATASSTLHTLGTTWFSGLTSGPLAVDSNGKVYKAASTTYSTGLTWLAGNVTCDTASGSVFGCLTSSHWTLFNNKISSSSLSATAPLVYNSSTGAFTFTGLATTSQPSSSNLLVSNGGSGVYGVATSTLSATSPLTGSFTQVGSGGALGIQAASGSQHGYLSSTDWSLLHTATTTFTYPLTYTQGTNAVTFPATSTLYGTGTDGQVLMWSGSAPVWAATSTSGGGISWPFDAGTYGGVANQSTTTPLWLKDTQIIASSTLFTNASTTNLSVSGKLWSQDWIMSTSTTVCAWNCQYSSIQTALNAGFKDIQLKGESYAGPVLIDADDVTIRGVGMYRSLITCDASTNGLCVAIATSTNRTRITLQDFGIDNTNASRLGTGLDTSDTTHVKAARIRITDFNLGHLVQDTDNQAFYHSYDSLIYFDVNNCFATAGTLANKHTMIGPTCRVHADSATGIGYSFVNAEGWTLIDPGSEPGGSLVGTALRVDGSSIGITIISPWFEGNATGTEILSGALNTTITGGGRITGNTLGFWNRGSHTVLNGPLVSANTTNINDTTANATYLTTDNDYATAFLGIGTSTQTSADNRLTLAGAFSTALEPMLWLNNNGAFATAFSGIGFGNQVGGFANGTAKIGAVPGSGYTAAAFTIHVADSSKALQERVRIDVNGRMGIATSSPEAKLDVWGTSGGKVLTLFSNTGTKFMEMLNTGVTTVLGTWDFSGATVKQHQYPTITWPGSATTTTATTTVPIGSAFVAESWSAGECRVTSGSSGYRFGDGTNFMNYIVASTTEGRYSFSSNNTFTARERRVMEVGPLTAAQITCTVDKIVNN